MTTGDLTAGAAAGGLRLSPTSPPSSPHWPRRLLFVLLFCAASFGVDWWLHRTLVDMAYNTLIRVGIYAVLAASLNLVNGVTGQFSLGHAAFMVIGAYTGGLMSVEVAKWASPHPGLEGALIANAVFVLGIFASAITAGIAGLVVGLPTLRLQGDYLAIATLGFGQIVMVALKATPDVPLGGATGLTGVPTLTTLFWTILVTTASLLLLRNLQTGSPGRDFRAVREDEIAAAAVGVDVVRAKVVAFIVAAAFAGVAGTLYVHLNNGINPDQAGFLYSIQIVVMVVLGGMGSLTGAALGGAILTIYSALFEGLPSLNAYGRYENVIYPVLLLLLMMVRREGLMGYRELTWESATAFYRRWRKMGRL